MTGSKRSRKGVARRNGGISRTSGVGPLPITGFENGLSAWTDNTDFGVDQTHVYEGDNAALFSTTNNNSETVESTSGLLNYPVVGGEHSVKFYYNAPTGSNDEYYLRLGTDGSGGGALIRFWPYDNFTDLITPDGSDLVNTYPSPNEWYDLRVTVSEFGSVAVEFIDSEGNVDISLTAPHSFSSFEDYIWLRVNDRGGDLGVNWWLDDFEILTLGN